MLLYTFHKKNKYLGLIGGSFLGGSLDNQGNDSNERFYYQAGIQQKNLVFAHSYPPPPK